MAGISEVNVWEFFRRIFWSFYSETTSVMPKQSCVIFSNRFPEGISIQMVGKKLEGVLEERSGGILIFSSRGNP